MRRYTAQRLRSRYAKILRKEPERSSASRAAAPVARPNLAVRRNPFWCRPRAGCSPGFCSTRRERLWACPEPRGKNWKGERREKQSSIQNGGTCYSPSYLLRRLRDDSFQRFIPLILLKDPRYGATLFQHVAEFQYSTYSSSDS